MGALGAVMDGVTIKPLIRAEADEPDNYTISYMDRLDSKLSPEADIIIGTYLIIIALLTFSLNGLVLVTVMRRKRSCMPLEIYIVNLTLIDILPSFFFPLDVFSLLTHRWKFGVSACKISSTFAYFCGIASITTVALMGFMRYLNTYHNKYGIRIKSCHVYWSLLVIYGNSGLWSLSPYVGWGSYAPEPFGVTCTLDWKNLDLSYLVSIFLFNYILPVVVIVFSYGCITYKMCQMTAATKAQLHSRKDVYMAKMTLMMSVGFVLAWTPYAYVSFYTYIRDAADVPLVVNVAAPYIAKSSNFYNPIIYFISVKRFRQDVREVFCPWALLEKTALNQTQQFNISSPDSAIPMEVVLDDNDVIRTQTALMFERVRSSSLVPELYTARTALLSRNQRPFRSHQNLFSSGPYSTFTNEHAGYKDETTQRIGACGAPMDNQATRSCQSIISGGGGFSRSHMDVAACDQDVVIENIHAHTAERSDVTDMNTSNVGYNITLNHRPVSKTADSTQSVYSVNFWSSENDVINGSLVGCLKNPQSALEDANLAGDMTSAPDEVDTLESIESLLKEEQKPR